MNIDDLKKTPLFQGYWSSLGASANLELWALKVQIYVEFRLKHLLSVRLGTPSEDEEEFIKQFETINYHHLLLLALAGNENKRLRGHLMKLNNVRKSVAHKFQATDYLPHLRTFVEAVSSSRRWPDTPEEQLTAVQVALAVITTLVELRIRDAEFCASREPEEE
jgi:hypothetical protein